jgi:hypothetical protein
LDSDGKIMTISEPMHRRCKMAEVLYTPNPKNVKDFFNTIKSLGTPSKVTTRDLPKFGFKSSNDRYLIGLSKFLGFIDSAGKPTAKWNDFKDNAKAPKVMADSIKKSYADLYSTYPDAEKQSDNKLKDYFASTSGASGKVAGYMVQTFKNLCGFADFEAVTVEEPSTAAAPTPTAPASKEVAEITKGVRPITVNINIQLQLPATEDATIYDTLFSALKKHLFS